MKPLSGLMDILHLITALGQKLDSKQISINKAVSKMGLEILEETSILGVILKVVFRCNQTYFSERNYTMLFALKEKGQGLVEYAIILALIAIVVIAVMGILGKKVNNTFNSIQNSLPS